MFSCLFPSSNPTELYASTSVGLRFLAVSTQRLKLVLQFTQSQHCFIDKKIAMARTVWYENWYKIAGSNPSTGLMSTVPSNQ